ncbi:redoxin domain-containing protein [Symmachiella dynata]|uniref:redoxin domain-containing protein n=1 Tax=Symmachiella dynata TaxID=2527995 RepID=UPI0030EDFAC5
MTYRSFGFAVLLCAIHFTAAVAEDAGSEPQVPNTTFRLPTVDGKVVELADGSAGLTVVCFLGSECPLARLYGPGLNKLAAEFESQGVRFVGINSNLQDSTEDVREYAKQYAITFPMAKDYENKVADQYRAKRTPEVFVVDEQLAIRYRGRIDDQYLPGRARTKPAREDLRIAIEELLSGKSVTMAVTEPNGCIIGREKKGEVTTDLTFTKDIARVLNQHCVECHRPGEIGPFSLTDYDEVIGWADMMLETIDDGRMPPWHANPQHGEFSNARHMPDADKQAFTDWVEGGMPYGDVKDLPELPKFADGWLMPHEPDVVVEMRERPFTVPAEGTVEYQYFVVDPGFEEDKWVTGSQVIPGNRGVVHHCIVFIRPPDGSDFRGIGWLSAYVPGQRFTMLPPHRGRKIPAGSKLVFQMHYTPNGSEQEDLTKIGLLFGEEQDITHEVLTLVGIDQEFEIPPHAADYPVEGRVERLPKQGELLAIVPHMHLRGKSFRLFGKHETDREVLLDVPQYDFNWQHVYELAEPMPLSSVKALEFTVKFDNSKANLANPDPSQHVSWGDQTWEEMAVAFFEVSIPRGKKDEWKRDKKPVDPQIREKEIQEFVATFLKNFDKNGDGEVAWLEAPLGFRRFGFRNIDKDKDRRLTKSEVEAAARRKNRF